MTAPQALDELVAQLCRSAFNYECEAGRGPARILREAATAITDLRAKLEEAEKERDLITALSFDNHNRYLAQRQRAERAEAALRLVQSVHASGAMGVPLSSHDRAALRGMMRVVRAALNKEVSDGR